MVDAEKLTLPFPPDSVRWRVGATAKSGEKGLALAYLDARDVMDRLDSVCGTENWQSEYVNAGNGKTCCRIGIRFGDNWVWKSDGAGDTAVEGDKGAFSDALKRAAVSWGIGRYLYKIENIWVRLEKAGNSYKIASSEKPRLALILNGRVEKKPTGPSKADSRPVYDKLYKGISQIMREGSIADLVEWGKTIKSEIQLINSGWHDQLRAEYSNALYQMQHAEKTADSMVENARNGGFPDAELERESV